MRKVRLLSWMSEMRSPEDSYCAPVVVGFSSPMVVCSPVTVSMRTYEVRVAEADLGVADERFLRRVERARGNERERVRVVLVSACRGAADLRALCGDRVDAEEAGRADAGGRVDRAGAIDGEVDDRLVLLEARELADRLQVGRLGLVQIERVGGVPVDAARRARRNVRVGDLRILFGLLARVLLAALDEGQHGRRRIRRAARCDDGEDGGRGGQQEEESKARSHVVLRRYATGEA